MSDSTADKPRRGRPKIDPSVRTQQVSITLPASIIAEIEYDMEAHDQSIKSEKMKEIIQYWLDNCPDRVEKDIKRKKQATSFSHGSFGR